MNNQHIFDFKTNLTGISIPATLNNPFGTHIPEIARLAANEFQEFIIKTSHEWEHDFSTQKGKMFGILVIQREDESYGYLGTVSGKLLGSVTCNKFTPSVFDESTDDFFINRGMRELTNIGHLIKVTDDAQEIMKLKESRKLKSHALQQRLFENYRFVNINGKEQDVIEIFENSSHGNPPAAAGECAAPKLLNYAITKKLNPIAIAEFWWGTPPKGEERQHLSFYPACKNKCRPILEYMLNDTNLFNQVNTPV